MIAFSRPFWPLFLHVFGAMVLVGAVLTVVILAFTAWKRPDVVVLRRATLRTLIFVAIPAYIVFRVAAQWIYSKEDEWPTDPAWIGIGFIVSDLGLLILLITTGLAYWWSRSGKQVVGRIVAGLSAVYLLLLAIAWMAMSGKWG